MLTAQDILQDLDRYCTFPHFNGIDYEEPLYSDTVDEIIKALENSYCFNGETWDYDYGATKMVIIFKHLPFVIKIPFMTEADLLEDGTYVLKSSCCNKSCATTRDYTYISRLAEEDFLFKNANNNGFLHLKNDWDYCEAETEIYKLVQQEDLIGCFAETKFIGTVQGYPIYMQSKGEIFCETSSKDRSNSKASFDKVSDITKVFDTGRLSDEWLVDFLEFFGEEMLKKFLAFINNNHIHDLHSGNVGYIDGIPTVIDYGGFYED